MRVHMRGPATHHHIHVHKSLGAWSTRMEHTHVASQSLPSPTLAPGALLSITKMHLGGGGTATWPEAWHMEGGAHSPMAPRGRCSGVAVTATSHSLLC